MQDLNLILRSSSGSYKLQTHKKVGTKNQLSFIFMKLSGEIMTAIPPPPIVDGPPNFISLSVKSVCVYVSVCLTLSDHVLVPMEQILMKLGVCVGS